MQKIGRIDKSKLSTGLFLDQKQQTSPLWTEGSNVLFSNDMIQVFPGSAPILIRPESAIVTGLLEFSSIVTGDSGVLFGYLDKLYLWDATNGVQQVGSGYTGEVDSTASQLATRWSMTQYNEYLFSTNGVDPLQLLKVVGTGFVAQTANTSTQFKFAEIVRKMKQFVLCYNLTLAAGTRQGNAFAWCDVNLPETWVPTTTNSARKLYIPHLKSDILCVEELEEAHIVYATDGAYGVTYAGYPDVFRADPLHDGIGVFGKNCVTEVKGKHVGLGPRGFWMYDGHSYEYIDTPPVRKYLSDNLNRDQASKCVVYNDRLLQHVLIFFPSTDNLENTLGLAWNYAENKFTKTVFARTVAVDSGHLAGAVSGDVTGNVYMQSLSNPASTAVEHTIDLEESGFVYNGYGDGGYGTGSCAWYGGQTV